MTEEELEKEVTRLRNENLDIINKYTRFAETDRRTIAELEAQIEKMKIKWHDLRKDPNDLPKESCSVLVTYEYDARTYTDNYINDKEHNIVCWESEYEDPYCAPRVIAWTEKPMFKEIKEK